MSIYAEHRSKIVQRMCFALKETKEFRDLQSMDYTEKDDGTEIITFIFTGGANFRCDVTAETDLRMIQHIMRRVSALAGMVER